MAEEIDDNGFYREDFSVESDWEIFNAQLCELFQRWELSNNDWGRSFLPNELFQCNWKRQEQSLYVKSNPVVVTYYKADLKSLTSEKYKDNLYNGTSMAPMHQDLLSLGNTFGPTIFDDEEYDDDCLGRLYGLRRFVVLKPLTDQYRFITKRYVFSFYISAISVVAAEVCSSVPIFVQIYDQKWKFFLGKGITSCMRTNFDLVALDQPPKDYCFLSGLLSMFKEKLPRHCKQPSLVSVRHNYSLDTVQIRVPMYVPFRLTPQIDEERSIISLTSFIALPHGYNPEASTENFAVFTWPELTDNMIIDSAIQTQFLPSKAPCGAAYQVVFFATSYLTSCIEYYLHLRWDKTSHRNKRVNIKPHGPMTEHELNQMLYYLFPDLHPDVALFPYETNDQNKDPHRIKSAVADSLVHRLSCLLATCHTHFGGEGGLAQLWAKFTRQIRTLWDCCKIIPGVSKGFPDTSTCLLHQKLQMLNVCIERRLKRKQGLKNTKQWPEDNEEDDDDNDTEEEFYDCDEDVEAIKRSPSPAKGQVGPTKPEGRLKRLRNLKLLDSEDYLYVPITQEPVLLLKLGSGSDNVTSVFHSTLQSHAEAFKAANLNAKFEDFIRWYSPHNWEEYEDEQGVKQHKLSPRMKADGNTWRTIWEEAKPVPVSRQKRLFDDTNEGFKVLEYLETRKLDEIYCLTVVPLIHSAILKLKNIFLNSYVLELFSDSLESLLADLSRFSTEPVAAHTPMSSNKKYNYMLQDIIEKMKQLEIQFYQYKCLERLLEPYDVSLAFVQDIFKEILENQGSFSLTSNFVRNSNLWSLFERDKEINLISKEYVMRIGDGLTSKAESERNQQNVKPIMPQFLRAIVKGEKLRLCGAFTENTTFLD